MMVLPETSELLLTWHLCQWHPVLNLRLVKFVINVISVTALYLKMFIPYCNGGMRGSPVTLDTTKGWSPLTDLTVLRKHHHVDKHNNASTSQETTEHHGGAATQQNTQLVNLLTNLLANSVTKEITKLLAKSLNK